MILGLYVHVVLQLTLCCTLNILHVYCYCYFMYLSSHNLPSHFVSVRVTNCRGLYIYIIIRVYRYLALIFAGCNNATWCSPRNTQCEFSVNVTRVSMQYLSLITLLAAVCSSSVNVHSVPLKDANEPSVVAKVYADTVVEVDGISQVPSVFGLT